MGSGADGGGDAFVVARGGSPMLGEDAAGEGAAAGLAFACVAAGFCAWLSCCSTALVAVAAGFALAVAGAAAWVP
ncbi:hypothetical protein [Thioflavicoccus mobilis]|uniref:hypothetical protein n=1 Tax=Thioflavicoccus mobilis TaxID=80679 RepID=UPI0012FCE692|nr:hypothetical protein [Thioflavicoccus mobilis]